MAHRHVPRSGPGTRGLRGLAVAVLLPAALGTVLGLVLLWPGETPSPANDQAAEQVDGVVSAVDPRPCPAPDPARDGSEAEPPPPTAQDEEPRCGTATVRLDDERGPGRTVETVLSDAPGSPEVDQGDRVLVAVFETPEGDSYVIVDHQRGRGLWVLVGACALAIVTFGRWRGVASVVGLGASFAVLLLFVVPAILDGEPPLPVAIVGAAAIALTVLYLTHGISVTTTVAVIGTLASLALTAALSAIAVSALHLTGVADDLTTFIGFDLNLNTEGLLLAGIVIGSLGVLDDVTVTQAATVQELALADPTATATELYRAGARVGRAHIASVVNTIVLAYAGSSLPLLILVVAAGDSLGDVVTDQVIAQELVRSAVGTLGLVAAVPITTGLAALAAREARRAPAGSA